MQILPTPAAASGASPATGPKLPQGTAVSGAALLFGGILPGGASGAATPALPTQNGLAANAAAPSVPFQLAGPPGQTVATAAQLANQPADGQTPQGAAADAPGQLIAQLLRGDTAAAAEAATSVSVPDAVTTAVATPPTGGPAALPVAPATPPAGQENGAPGMTPAATASAAAAAAEQQAAQGQRAAPAQPATPALPTETPAVPATPAIPAAGRTAPPVNPVADPVPGPAVAAAVPQATRAIHGDPAALRERGAGALKPAGAKGAAPAQTGIPAAAPAQTAPGLAVAAQAVTQSASLPTPIEAALAAGDGRPDPLPAAHSQGQPPAHAAASGAEFRLPGDAAAQIGAYQAARGLASQPPSEQVAVQITRAVEQGTDRITVQLHPASLGRISVEIELGHDHRLHAVIAADRQDTLDLLQRDARALERALNDAGLKTDSGSLSFNLRGDGDHKGAGQSADQTKGPTLHLPADDEAADAAVPYDRGAAIGLSGGIDIRV